jgi:hypothetical protein
MANETIYAWGTQKPLEASGAGFADGAIVQANDASYATGTDGAGFPDAVFVLKIQFAAVSGIEGRTIALYVRPLNIDGSNDAPAPTATYLQKYVGSFYLQASANNTDQYVACYARDLPPEGDYYLGNNSGTAASAGWSLKVTPKSYKPA